MNKATLDLARGLMAGNRQSLARAITLVESTNDLHRIQAEHLLDHVTEETNAGSVQRKTSLPVRLGIAGPPGAGKSTLIENLGCSLTAMGLKVHSPYPRLPPHGPFACPKNDPTNVGLVLLSLDICPPPPPPRHHRTPPRLSTTTTAATAKVAVLTIDPSSHVTGGSILGDKARMHALSHDPRAYVRASPSKGVLGGLSRYTADVVSLCEGGGYDVVVVETVGLGQSEVKVRKPQRQQRTDRRRRRLGGDLNRLHARRIGREMTGARVGRVHVRVRLRGSVESDFSVSGSLPIFRDGACMFAQ